MTEKRSLYNIIFGDKNKQTPQTMESTQLRMLNGYTPAFSSFGSEAYNSDVVRSAVDAIARNGAKLKAKHVRKIDSKVTPTNSNLENLLQVRPNPYMDSYSFFYKVITNLYMKNNSFIFVDIDPFGTIRGFYPITSSNIELLESNSQVFIRFDFMGGDKITLPYTDVIHLRKFFYKNDFWGESSDSALNPTLELINTTNEGIINAIKSSANIRGLLKFEQVLKPSDIKAERDRFVSDYLSMSNNGGVAAIDQKATYIPLDNKPEIVNKDQMDFIKQSVYNYFGVNESIINSNYSEDQWNAFYESVLEPLSIQMSLEFTAKCFSDREKGHGNEIVFESNRLQYASNKTKIELIKTLAPLGLLTLNECREIFNLSSLEDGDKRLVSLNFVNADKQDQYQIGKDNTNNENTPKNE